MGRRCEEPYCLQIIPDHLFLSHQDQHLAERLAAEEFEQQHQNNPTATDEALARALADEEPETESLGLADEDVDYQLALALNREFRTEEEERSFRNVQKREIGVESQEEEERQSKMLRLDQPQPRPSTQLVLGPNLTPTRSTLRSNETKGLIHGLQRALQDSTVSAYSVLCHPGTSHFGSEFSTLGWGCGYNNAQMILSSIRETSLEIYTRAFGDQIPSIGKIQSLIEAGWAKGIDREGAGQLREKLGDTRKWIGTTEIYTLLTSAGFRCLVHDFDFSKPPHTFSLIRYVDDYFQCSNPPSSGPSCRISDRPPLYFQHRGHSRTIVGIEHLKSKHINLLLYDPSHRPSSALKDLSTGKANKKKDFSEGILKPYRVSIDDLAKKREYQILRLQEGMIDVIEAEKRKMVNFIKMN